MSWRPIETAPKDGTRVVLCCAKTLRAVTCRWDASESYWLATHETRYYFPHYFSHWMPLPAPPIEGTVTDPAEGEASQVATGGPESRDTENIVSVPPAELKAKGDE